MKRSPFLNPIFTLISAVFTVLVFKQRVFGLTFNDSATKSNPKGLPLQTLPTNDIDVWNNVIDIDNLAPLLHDESRRIGLGHKVFSRTSSRTSSTSTPTNIIEQTLDSILTELNDDSKYIEYWTRLEWRSIHAHADIDEYRAKQENQSSEMNSNGFRYPRNGHVLYLQVGSQVRGPTCVFPNRSSGGDLLRNIKVDMLSREGGENSIDDDENSEHERLSITEKKDGNCNIELVTVPAVPGRLLRFKGDYLHAVPRPTDLWLLKFVKGSPLFEPEEDWGRSVILFNTWDDEPPLGIPLDESNNDSNLSIDDEHLHESRSECNKIHQWSRETPSTSSAPLDVSQTGSEGRDHCERGDDVQSTKIWLLGDYRRRDYKMQTVKLESNDSLREALYQESTVMSTKLRIP